MSQPEHTTYTTFDQAQNDINRARQSIRKAITRLKTSVTNITENLESAPEITNDSEHLFSLFCDRIIKSVKEAKQKKHSIFSCMTSMPVEKLNSVYDLFVHASGRNVQERYYRSYTGARTKKVIEEELSSYLHQKQIHHLIAKAYHIHRMNEAAGQAAGQDENAKTFNRYLKSHLENAKPNPSGNSCFENLVTDYEKALTTADILMDELNNHMGKIDKTIEKINSDLKSFIKNCNNNLIYQNSAGDIPKKQKQFKNEKAEIKNDNKFTRLYVQAEYSRNRFKYQIIDSIYQYYKPSDITPIHIVIKVKAGDKLRAEEAKLKVEQDKMKRGVQNPEMSTNPNALLANKEQDIKNGAQETSSRIDLHKK